MRTCGLCVSICLDGGIEVADEVLFILWRGMKKDVTPVKKGKKKVKRKGRKTKREEENEDAEERGWGGCCM